MKILITGGAGFIGSAVVRLAVSRGHEGVHLAALTSAACLENVAPVAHSPLYAFERADIRDPEALTAIFAAAFCRNRACFVRQGCRGTALRRAQ